MKTEKEVKQLLAEKLIELKSYGKTKTIVENAPVALIQANLEGQVRALRQILNP